MSLQRLLNQGSVIGRIALLSSGVGVAWLLTAGPAYLLAGGSGVLGSALAAALCLMPGLLVLAAGNRWRGPNGLLVATIGGMVLRMLVVLGGGAALYVVFDRFDASSLAIWLVVFYLLTLALETGILATSHQQ